MDDQTCFLPSTVLIQGCRWWYSPILPSETGFPLSCRQTLTSFILSISNHLSRKRPADPFLDFLTNSTSIVIVFLNELSTALCAGQGQSTEDAIHQYLNEEPDSNLANVLSKQQQERKLGLIADDVLTNFLDSKALSFPPSKTFLREILSGVVLETTVRNCSKPEWINGWIVYLLEGGEPEIMNAIDAGVESMASPTQSMPKSPIQIDAEKRHARHVSRAEEAMQEAMLEAKRLNEMIAEEDARKRRNAPSISENEDAISTATTEGMATPTSSDSDRNRTFEKSVDPSMVPEQTAVESSPAKSASPKANTFTDFDQLVPSETPTAPRTSHISLPTIESNFSSVLTLHKASVTIMEDGDPNGKSVLRSKPIAEYLLQIEPAVSRFPGWMIARRYLDFEPLHEVLRRISVISGVPEFAEKHAVLPTWKGQSKHYLRQNLERYLQHALQYEPLAESEAMKKFLEKETSLEKGPSANKNVFTFQGPAALENMGKGFVNVLGQAPKGLAGGGKAVLGGVQGVFGAVGGGLKKPAPAVARANKPASVTSLQRQDSLMSERASQESVRVSLSPTEIKEARPASSRQSTEANVHNGWESPVRSEQSRSKQSLHLPPPPSDIADDYGQSPKALTQVRTSSMPDKATGEQQSALPSPQSSSSKAEPSRTNTASSVRANNKPITEDETRASIELIFAIITELYSLSSAWTIRLSLLGAAKTFLLRPNNPQMESIRLLLQDSVIDANFVSDTGLAGHLSKLRENTLPTEEELKKWPPVMTAADKEKLRVKARKLLVERGMPQALTSVMGSAASGEALGRVFDCLQVEEVARGLIFALLLQALKATMQ
jgi:PXA domain/Sorting nexin C terminal/PX domain